MNDIIPNSYEFLCRYYDDGVIDYTKTLSYYYGIIDENGHIIEQTKSQDEIEHELEFKNYLKTVYDENGKYKVLYK